MGKIKENITFGFRIFKALILLVYIFVKVFITEGSFSIFYEN